jgi:starch synthase
VYVITPYYQYNKKMETDYLARDGFQYERTIKVASAHFQYQFGIHRGKYCGVNYIWFHNHELFSKPYDGEAALYVTKQLVFFALVTLESFCQLKIFPSITVTNDWMCGFVGAYVKCQRYSKVFDGTKFMHICHNLDPLYEGRLYPKVE